MTLKVKLQGVDFGYRKVRSGDSFSCVTQSGMRTRKLGEDVYTPPCYMFADFDASDIAEDSVISISCTMTVNGGDPEVFSMPVFIRKMPEANEIFGFDRLLSGTKVPKDTKSAMFKFTYNGESIGDKAIDLYSPD